LLPGSCPRHESVRSRFSNERRPAEQRLEFVLVVLDEFLEVLAAVLLDVVDVVLGLDRDLLQPFDPRDVRHAGKQDRRSHFGLPAREVAAANFHASRFLLEPLPPALDAFPVQILRGSGEHEQGALGAFDLTREREAAECGLADKARDSVRRVRGVEIVVAAVVAGEPREQAATRVHLDVLRGEADGGDTTAGERVDDLGGVDDTLGDFLPSPTSPAPKRMPKRRTISSLIWS